MKTSYYLVAAAGLSVAVAVAYHQLPARAETPAATLPLPHDSASLAPMPAVPDLPLPAIVPPPDGPLVIPISATPAPLPALPTTPTIPPPPSLPTTPPTAAPALPNIPPVATSPTPMPLVPPVGTPVVPQSIPSVPEIPTTPSIAPPPAAIVPHAPPAPNPLPPLTAPTPVAPGLETLKPEPAAKLAPAGKLIVLKGNKLVEGTVTTKGDRIVVRRGALDRAFDKLDVLFVADSRDEVYRFMLAKVDRANADARLAVAKWCTLHGLREQALAEAHEILKLQPAHRGAADLARSMEESLRQFPADGSTPKTHGALVTVVEPEVDVAPEAAASFVSRAQPILANQCMECHARDNHASAFRLKRVTGFEVGPETTHANLRAVANQLKKDDPIGSPLLVKALVAHGGMKQPAFVTRQAMAFRLLEAWVVSAVGNTSALPMTPPTPPVAAPTASVPPIPPATAAEPRPSQATAPVALPMATPPTLPPALPPIEPTPIVVPPVLPTPPSIPPAETSTRSTPAKLPAIPVVPASASLPKPPVATKPASQFGTSSKLVVPMGMDEFDPSAFNRTVPNGK